MKQRLHLKMFVVLAFLLVQQLSAWAQVSINYPGPAQGLTRGTGKSNLTVQLGFTAVCTGTTVTIALPPSINYVAGSVTKTAGSLTGSTITENNIANLNAPVFSVNGVTSAGDITFTISRQADCGALANGKDTVKVNSTDCGTAIENNASTNTYNILAPVLSLIPPAAITNAVIGTTATRTITITNGGNGCTDTVRFYVVYPAGGIINTAANAITANGTSFSPSSNNGDTLFYKIFGATLFGGDNLLCNGETVTITEPVKIVKCATTSAYSATWGNKCQTATGTSAVTMANGVPVLTTTIVENTVMSPCTPGNVTVTFSNTGSGGSAGAMYNIVTQLGNLNPNLPNVVFGPTNTTGSNTTTGVTFNNFMINSVPVTVTQTGTGAWIADMSQFTTDPDGAGGLTDLDGDGQFDDLAPGAALVITMKREYQPFAPCVIPDYYRKIGAKATFNTMCGTLTAPLATLGGTTAQSTSHVVIPTAPTLVSGGTPFTIRFCHSGFGSQGFSLPTDSLYLKMDLPAGIAYVPGTGQFNGGAAATISSSGTTLIISAKRNGATLFCFNADFIYTCGASGNIVIPYEIYHVLARSCNAIESFKCGTLTITTKCPAPCPTGIANLSPAATRTNYGWTNTTMTAKVDPATLTSLARKTATVYDTIEIIQPGKQSGSYSNLYYSYQMNKAGSADVVKFEGGTINYKAGGTGPTISCLMPAYTNMSTATLTKWVWNFTPLMGGACGFPAALVSGDSVWIDMKLSVTNANSNNLFAITLTAPPNQLSYMYNLDAASAEQYCDVWAPDFYLVGLKNSSTTNYAATPFNLTGCTPATTSFVNYGFTTGEAGDIFPAEYRPAVSIDSIVILFPPGITWTGAMPTMLVDTFITAYNPRSTAMGTTATMTGNRLVLKNFGNGYFSDLLPQNYTHNHNTYFEVVASCAAAATNNNFVVTTYGKSFVYAGANIPFVSTYSGTGASLTANYDATTKPNITVQNNTGVIQGVLPQQYWDVQVNSSGTTTAPYVWFALEKSTGSGGISIDSVVLKPSNVVLTALTYNTTDKWYKVSTAGLTSGSFQQARVYFKYSSCSADSILLKSGWNCTGYPGPDPLTGYSCTAAQTYLKVIPQPSQVQLSVTRQPGNGSSISLCNTDSVLVVINSAQAGNLISPYVNVYPPAGVSIQLPVQVEYPLGSGNYQNTIATAISGGYKLDITSHTGIGVNGLPGTITNPGTAGRQAKLKVMFNTTCGITSGSPLSFEPYGTQPCGAPAIGNGITVQTGGITITGASTSGGAGITMGVGASSISCGTATTLNLSTTPVITPTQTGDTVIYTIPAGLLYNGNFMGTGFGTITTAFGPGGTTLVKIPLPAGVAAGTVINYSFDVVGGGTGGCGNVNILAAAKRDIAPLMCGGVACTSSTVIIGTATSGTITLTRPSLSTSNFTFTENLATSPRVINYSFNIANSGTQAASAGAYLVKIYCGADNTGKVLATFTTNAVGIGSAITQTGSFIYAAYTDCAKGSPLFLQIQDTTAAGVKVCLCNSPAGSLSAQVLPVKLTAFTGTPDNCNANLAWITIEETNFNYFEVEQSTDAVNFVKIATVNGRGFSNGSTYAGVYNQPAKVTYYRLKMVDKNGATTFSNLVVVKTNCTTNLNVSVYPNPVKNTVTLTGLSGQTELRLVNVLGQVLTSVFTFNSTQQIDLSKYPAATYMLQVVQNNAIIKNIKLIKE
ncbi:T9SS type A sorting domain-containing protein [Ferruginibacter sp. SUN106]|uniref:T9SS type A sorting domain-containing protein n=1 Tax=Ferruginibacter sp. SUN106 TaxID=2978348 RepID=UPI003D365062